ncbi:type I-E CRISPR-associated protein Cse1/CasA [Synechococcus sp. RC10B2]|uniref:type I-E CRISPR-associated protein Cse1/CasA n=1 Tax=unclassified Synechococcus TaxID=2626047 RepID=UPI0039C6A205
METQSFNLTKEKWIPVLDPDFRIQELSLVELFREWESLKEMRGDNPPTTLALYRFLLAIMHRAYLGPKDTDHWKEIFQDNGKVVPTPVGVNRPSFAVLSVGESRCPHTRGGEPLLQGL